MKKSVNLGRSKLSEEELDEYYKEAAMDSLLYWVNCTISAAGANATLTILTEMLATSITHLVPVKQVDRAETVILDLLKESFDIVREGSSDDDKVSSKSSDLN